MITSIQTCASWSPGRLQAEFSLPPDVIFVTVHDGSARLLNMAGHFHAVPTVGALMLQETLTNGADAAAKRLAREYHVDVRQVQSDLTVFLAELQEQRLLCNNTGPARTLGLGLARMVLRPALNAIYRLSRSPESRARALLGLARIAFSLFGWTRTIAVWKEAHARIQVERTDMTEENMARVVDHAVRAAAASHLFEVECKERALCCWALARVAGLDAALVVGINLFPLAGHCWCEVGPWTLSDGRDRCAAFTPVGRW